MPITDAMLEELDRRGPGFQLEVFAKASPDERAQLVSAAKEWRAAKAAPQPAPATDPGIVDRVKSAARGIGITGEGLAASALAGPGGPLIYAGMRAGQAAGIVPKTLEEAGTMAKDIAIDEAAGVPAALLAGPLAGSPLIERPIRAMIRSRFPGEPKEDLSQAAWKGAKRGAVETAVSAAASIPLVAREAATAVRDRISSDKIMGGLTKFFKSIVEHDGPVEAQKAAASKLFDRAAEAAGSTPLPVDNFIKAAADIVDEGSMALVGGHDAPEVKMLIDAAGNIHRRGGGEAATLPEIQKALSKWGKRIELWANDPPKQLVAIRAHEALTKDLVAATGNPVLGDAAKTLAEARGRWAAAKGSENLQEVLVAAQDKTSIAKNIDPGKFLTAVTGKNEAAVEGFLANSPARLARLRAGIDAVKAVARKRPNLLPESIGSPRVTEALNNVIRHHDVVSLLGAEDPAVAEMFKMLLDPPRALGPEGALSLIAGISSRLESSPRREQQP